MAIGIDDINDVDDLDDFNRQDLEDSEPSGSDSGSSEDEDYISTYLKSKGISDIHKILFENDDGNIEEKDWDSLSNEDKLGILSDDSNVGSEDGLDENEAQLIDSIRLSGLSPSEYLQKIQSDSVNAYVKNKQNDMYQYEVDLLNDDELFVYDFISRMGDVTDDEVQEALELAKSNPTLFSKLIGAIRKEYKDAEADSLRQSRIEQEAQAKEQYDLFANSIVDQINDLLDYSGYDINMTDDDKLMLYDFIVGYDAAGNNYFAKALSDPKVLVRTAWLALNGELIIHDITDYFQKEISNVRKESYNKGKADAQRRDNVVFKNKTTGDYNEVYDDLD